jgi:hypothetical protein
MMVNVSSSPGLRISTLAFAARTENESMSDLRANSRYAVPDGEHVRVYLRKQLLVEHIAATR